MKPRTIAINGNGGAYTLVSATQWTWRVEILEDFSANAGLAQGLQYLTPDPTSPDPGNPNWLGPNGSTATVTSATVGGGGVPGAPVPAPPTANDASATAWTLPDCLGVTGTPYQITNIGAGTITFSGKASEAITGATTLAQNLVAVFQAQLISQSAAGCGWQRIQ